MEIQMIGDGNVFNKKQNITFYGVPREKEMSHV